MSTFGWMWGFFFATKKGQTMSEGNDGGAQSTGTGAAGASTDDKNQSERANWTPEQWEDWATLEAGRRVTDAQKKWNTDLAERLTAKEKDSETKINEVLKRAEQAETRAAFAERANKAGISDMKAAWALVQTAADDYTDRRGEVDFDKLKENHPALFGVENKRRPVSNAPGDSVAKPKTLGDALKRTALGGL